ncbi:MAG: N-acetylmuramic acid 6-phosphate etherase, partial [Planctomycetota bacterium]
MSDADPSDRGYLATEQRLAAAAAIDALSIEATLRLMNTQDMEVPLAIRKAIPQIAKVVEIVVKGMKQGGRLIYCGAGTSGRLGVLDASECPPTFFSDPDQVVGLIAGGDTALRNAVEGAEDQRAGALPALEKLKLNEFDTLIGIAAGGTTPYVWGAIDYAHNHGAKTSLMTCVPVKTLMARPRAPVVKPNEPVSVPPRPELPAPVYQPIELLVGPEVLTGSTRLKAGTATKLALNMITTTAMLQLGKAWGNLMVDLRATNAKLLDRSIRIVSSQAKITREEAAEVLTQAEGRVKHALIMAVRGVDYAEAKHLLDDHDGKLRPILGP